MKFSIHIKIRVFFLFLIWVMVIKKYKKWWKYMDLIEKPKKLTWTKQWLIIVYSYKRNTDSTLPKVFGNISQNKQTN